MKRLLAVLTLASLVALLTLTLSGVAGATHSEKGNSAAPKQDFASGSGKFATVFGGGGIATAMEFSFSAHRSTQNPDEERGFINYRTVTFTGQGLNGKGHVVCLDVRANRAVVVGEFKENPPFGPAFPFILLFVEDNGEPSDPVPDRGLATAFTGQAGFPENCPPAPLFGTLAAASLPLESGNVTVHDGTAP